MLTSGYSNNKDARGLAEAQAKRAKEQQEAARKRHLASDIMAKKGFIFSTATTINMKSAVMKTKEMRINALQADIRSLDMKEQQIKALRDLKTKELSTFQREHDEIKKAIDQLSTSKTKMEAEVHKLEMEMR